MNSYSTIVTKQSL